MSNINRKELLKLVNNWETAGIISSDQSAKIRHLENLDSIPTNVKENFVVRLLCFGLIGLGIILILNNNWAEIPKLIRFASLLSATVLCDFIGISYSRKNQTENANLYYFLSSVLIGATIFLVGQMYNLNLSFELGYILWALTLIVTAFVTQSFSVSILFALIAFVCSIEVKLNLLTIPFFLVTTASLVYSTYKFDSRLIGFISYLFIASFCMNLGSFFGINEELNFYLFCVSNLILYSVLNTYTNLSPKVSAFIKKLLEIIFLTILFILGFMTVVEELIKLPTSHIDVKILLGILTVGFCYLTSKSIQISIISIFTLSLLTFLPFIPDNLVFETTVATNFLILISSCFLIYTGINNKSAKKISFAVSYLSVAALCRFFGITDNYVTSGIAFIVIAILVLFLDKFVRNKIK